ncbi:hypothetical protein C8P63_104140 [Melghirimyces profundicolus]|uniref:Uncharacterized protein n=1 Tax=Melghirimyces profundicolus TaxID=1242148 RepID=A0A2T6C4Q6_9BACL|nr:hypothetical protein [Melghirimyces profundicolus]PTX63295.1 hypothetical protein C8P63_104140 [Melghirimyces profundicolus]
MCLILKGNPSIVVKESGQVRGEEVSYAPKDFSDSEGKIIVRCFGGGKNHQPPSFHPPGCHINTNGYNNNLIAVANPRREVLFFRENTPHLSVDLNPGEYVVCVIVHGKISLMETRRLKVPERGDSDTYPVKGETDRYLSSETAQEYIDRIKKDKRLPKPG